MRRKMLRTAGILGLSFALSAGMAGCAGKGDGEPGIVDIQSVTIHDDGMGNNSEKKENGDAGSSSDAETGNNANSSEESIFYDGADLSGVVIDFSDTGCMITPRTLIVHEDGAIEGGVAAPGYESEDTNITITYTEDTVFQIIYFSASAQTEVSREDTDRSSVKKQTDVNIFGTCQDEQHWTADKVVITRWQ